jgi:hypothetical protein
MTDRTDRTALRPETALESPRQVPMIYYRRERRCGPSAG